MVLQAHCPVHLWQVSMLNAGLLFVRHYSYAWPKA